MSNEAAGYIGGLIGYIFSSLLIVWAIHYVIKQWWLDIIVGSGIRFAIAVVMYILKPTPSDNDVAMLITFGGLTVFLWLLSGISVGAYTLLYPAVVKGEDLSLTSNERELDDDAKWIQEQENKRFRQKSKKLMSQPK